MIYALYMHAHTKEFVIENYYEGICNRKSKGICNKKILHFSYYSDPSLYRASPIAASLLRGIFYSAFFTVNPDWLRGFTVV